MTVSGDAGDVVLVHGMGLPAMSLGFLAVDLRRAGYPVHFVHYRTRAAGVEGLVRRFLLPVFERCRHDRPIHVVAHSLGAILVRWYLQDAALPTGSRVVLLAPPNQGSEVVDRLRDWPPFRWFAGAVGQQLGTGPDGIVRRLQPVNAEVGVIAANRSLQPWFSRMLTGENDGVVTVRGTRLPEMRDFVVVESAHNLMLFNGTVRNQVLRFLATGRFCH
ncbi:MAG: alpha/beta fold hydrolase [Chromatiaceae bacterium]|nr:alpha/beta fold hydrolase [Chromatiaceae bacterium]